MSRRGTGPRILIVRTSALGDVVHALPALTALRRDLPRARIGWVVEEVFAPLLEGLDDLDEILPVALKRWRRRPLSRTTLSEVGAFLKRLSAFDAEIALDLMGNHKGGILAAVSNADRRLGLARELRREPSSSIWISEAVVPPAPHSVDRALATVARLGIRPEPADFAGERLFAGAPAALSDGPGEGDAYALIAPGAGWKNKIYPPRRWGRVAEILAERTGLACWVVSGPGEEALAREAVVASHGRARAVHAASLAALATVLRPARLVLGGDTGPVHLAHALGAPVLCVMGPTDPALSGPYGAPGRALVHRLPCSFCAKRLDGPKACLLTISAEAVAERALAQLA